MKFIFLFTEMYVMYAPKWKSYTSAASMKIESGALDVYRVV